MKHPRREKHPGEAQTSAQVGRAAKCSVPRVTSAVYKLFPKFYRRRAFIFNA